MNCARIDRASGEHPTILCSLAAQGQEKWWEVRRTCRRYPDVDGRAGLHGDAPRRRVCRLLQGHAAQRRYRISSTRSTTRPWSHLGVDAKGDVRDAGRLTGLGKHRHRGNSGLGARRQRVATVVVPVRGERSSCGGAHAGLVVHWACGAVASLVHAASAVLTSTSLGAGTRARGEVLEPGARGEKAGR